MTPMHHAHPGSSTQLDAVRRQVRDVLERTPAFKALPDRDRHEIAGNAVKVLRYLADPAAGQPELAATARALEDDNTFKELRTGNQKDVGSFIEGNKVGAATDKAGATMQGLVNTVDFPGFVSGLIDGVFTSIVNSSIKQMHEFGKFLEGVVKSVEDFAQDHISPAQAKQYLQDKFPGQLSMDGGQIALNDSSDKPPPDFQALLGMAERPDLDSDEGQQKLVLAAQLKMARMRQQQLSTLVLMGINRIVVTEGEIKASVLFDVSATSKASRSGETDEDFSDKRKDTQHDERGGGWFSDPDHQRDRTRMTVSTQHTHTEGKTSDDIKAHANLSGSVLVKFKSETFPLERLASSAEVANITEKSKK